MTNRKRKKKDKILNSAFISYQKYISVAIFTIFILIFSIIDVTAQTTDGLIIIKPEEGETFERHHITITALAQLDVTLRLTVNDKVVDEQKTVGANEFGIDISRIPQAVNSDLKGAWSFVSIELPTGPNTIKVTVMDGDYKESNVERSVHIIGEPAEVLITASDDKLPADAKSKTELTISVKDKWGYPIDRTFVTVSLESDYGNIVNEDVDPNKLGIQLRAKDGMTKAVVRANKQVGQTTIDVICNQVSASKKIKFTTPVRPFMLVGVADAQVGYLKTDGDTAGEYEDGLYNEERIAMYTKGTIFRNYLLTGSYDSARKYQDRLFCDLDPDRLYPLYGDSSSIFYDAQSSGKLYLKVEKEKSYAMWGDYNTQISDNELSAYERSFNGAKLHLDKPRYQLTAIAAETNRSIARDEIQGMGISGFYFLTNVPVVPGSEKIRIEVRDRYHSEQVLKSDVKYRYNDYDIDYEQGSIFFKQPIPGRDVNYNPVWIAVIYETSSASEKDLVAASHGELNFTNIADSGLGVSIGGTIVEEDNKVRAYQMRGIDGSLYLPLQTSLSAEFVQSRSFDIDDDARKVELESTPYRNLLLKAYYRELGDNYDNPSGPVSEIGTLKYGANGYWKFRETGELKMEHYRSKKYTNQMDITSTSIGYNQSILSMPSLDDEPGNIAVKATVENLRLKNEKSGDTHSTLATGSLIYHVSKRFSAALQRDQKIWGDTQTYKPNSTNINLDYEIIDGLVLSLQHKIEDKEPFRLDATTFGISSRLSEGLRAYGKYQIGGVIEGQRNQALIGFRNRWNVNDDLAINIAFERSNIIDDIHGAGDYDAFSISGEYLPTAPIKSGLKYEIRRDFLTTKQNAEAGIDLKVLDGLSAIGRHTFYLDKQKSSQNELHHIKNHTVFGLALRPVYSNKINILAKVDIKHEDNEIIKPSTNSLVLIGSTEGFYHPLRALEIMAKYALKRTRETSLTITSVTYTDIYIGGLTYQFFEQFDIGGEYRILHQHQTDDYEYGYAAEFGVSPINNVRIALGYNFRGSAEPDFPESEYWAQGLFFRIETKFTE